MDCCQNLYFLSTIACQLSECLDEQELEVLSTDLEVLSDMLSNILARKSDSSKGKQTSAERWTLFPTRFVLLFWWIVSINHFLWISVRTVYHNLFRWIFHKYMVGQCIYGNSKIRQAFCQRNFSFRNIGSLDCKPWRILIWSDFWNWGIGFLIFQNLIQRLFYFFRKLRHFLIKKCRYGNLNTSRFFVHCNVIFLILGTAPCLCLLEFCSTGGKIHRQCKT